SLMEAGPAFKPDLVVVDLSLPGGREADIAGRMMQRHPGLRLIVLSVHDEPTVVAQMLNGGVAGFVLKRAAATDLIPAIETALRGQVYVSAGGQQDRPEPTSPLPTGISGEE